MIKKIQIFQKKTKKVRRTTKLKVLIEYATSYKEEKNLDDSKYDLMVFFFKECLDKKKMHRVKDVQYDKDKQIILDIPGLVFNKNMNMFTLRNPDKHISTIKNLGPKKKTTIRNVDL